MRELPESLDLTYERILKEIGWPNRRIAKLVLQCLVVATRLFVSQRTVEAHVSRILAKLQLRSRAELARARAGYEDD